MAPEGKEVEELTGKEILQALRKKIHTSDYSQNKRQRGVREYREKETRQKIEEKPEKVKKLTAKEREKIDDELSKIPAKTAVIFNKDLEKIRKTPLRKIHSLTLNEKPYIIAIDGTATPRIMEICEKLGCHNLIAKNFVNTDTEINLVSL